MVGTGASEVTNQDVYEAIEADINAVNDRLKGVRHMEEGQEELDAEYVCNAPLQSDQTLMVTCENVFGSSKLNCSDLRSKSNRPDRRKPSPRPF